MRAHELFERAAQSYYMHCTSLENFEPIRKMGLIPNKSNKGQGNYEDIELAEPRRRLCDQEARDH
jgi:hypothetical protein